MTTGALLAGGSGGFGLTQRAMSSAKSVVVGSQVAGSALVS